MWSKTLSINMGPEKLREKVTIDKARESNDFILFS
jgi:hypothetical protein